MSDEEVVRALLVLARKLGVENRLVVAIQHGIGNREEVREEDALCLAYGRYREVRLLCTYGKDHVGKCTWELGMVGKSACISRYAAPWGEVLCERPTHHTGEHEATGADGVRWTWGDAPRETGLVYAANKARESAAMGCMAWEWGTNGHKAGCILSAGHEGPHKGLDADGKSIFTWPCPCYPDCTGHAVPGVPDVKGTVDWDNVTLTTDSPELRCTSRAMCANGAYPVCQLVKGHDGDHRHQATGGEVHTWPKSAGEAAADPSIPRT